MTESKLSGNVPVTFPGKIPSEEERLHANMLGMLDALISIVAYLDSHNKTTIPPIILTGGRKVIEKYDKKSLITMLVAKSEEHWDKIHEKKEDFFINNADKIFAMFGTDKVTIFTTLFTATDTSGKKLVSEQNKENLWRFIHSMVKISIKYCMRVELIGKDKLAAHMKKWDISK